MERLLARLDWLAPEIVVCRKDPVTTVSASVLPDREEQLPRDGARQLKDARWELTG